MKTSRRTFTSAAVFVTSVAAVLAGVGTAQADNSGSPASPLTASDGTNKVIVNGTTVTFPGPVSDAAWSPDGSRVAYVSNNVVYTAKPDGTDVVAVSPNDGAVRSHPAWAEGGADLIYARSGNGSQTLYIAQANGARTPEGAAPVEKALWMDPASAAGASWPDEAFEPNPVAGPGSEELVAFQRNDVSGSAVWIEDRFPSGGGGPTARKIDAGTHPAFSPEASIQAKRVAYVKVVNGISQIFVANTFDANPVGVQVTFDAFNHDNPVWSPDGARIFFDAVGKDVESVAAKGAAPNTPKVELSGHGTPLPAFQTLNQNHLIRRAGADRVATAVAVSQGEWATPGVEHDRRKSAESVVISRSDQFADALGGSALAARSNGPLLLTPSTLLDPSVLTEIKRVLPVLSPAHAPTVYLLGGEQALSPGIAAELKADGYNVQRIGGADRYETSVDIAKRVSPGTPNNVLVATGNLFPDALSAGAAAGSRPGSVVVLTNDKAMPPVVGSYLAGLGSAPKVYAVGGQADTALTSVGYTTGGSKPYTRLAGSDRYLTSYLVARTFFPGHVDTAPDDTAVGAASVGLATGRNWPDSLSGGAMMAVEHGPVLLVDPVAGPTPQETAWLSATSGSLGTVYAFGGTVALPDAPVNTAAALVSGPAGYDHN